MKTLISIYFILYILLILPSALPAFFEGCDLDIYTAYKQYKTDHIWNRQGKKINIHNDFRQREYQLFADYYFTRNDCLSLHSSFVEIEEILNRNTRGFTDPELIWTHCFYSNGTESLCTELTAIIPVAGQKHELRYGRFGGELGLYYSTCVDLSSHPVYFDATLGYRAYSGYPSDQIRNTFIVGSYLLPGFYLEGRTDLHFGVFNGKSHMHHPLVFFNANYRLLKAQIRGVLNIYSGFYVSLGCFGHVWGQNVGTGGGFLTEAWFVF